MPNTDHAIGAIQKTIFVADPQKDFEAANK
jgi:hypothetical protein